VLLDLERLSAVLQDRYVIEREIGRGGAATVYLALDIRHNRPVAIKVLRPELGAGIVADRFRSEIEIASRLAHPAILPVFDSGASEDLLYYVMPFMEGESLRDHLERERVLPVEQALRIARDVGEALAYAHARDVVHRDIKPENILLVEGHAVVADFGIARAIARATQADRLTTPGLAIGTPLYMSPEQATGEREVDARSDIYSLACVLCEMLTGAAPHAATTPTEMIARKFSGVTSLPRFDRLDLAPGIEAAVRTALARDPADRFGTVTQFIEAISPRISGSRLASDSSTRRLAARLSRRALFAAAAAILLVAAGIAGLVWRRGHPALAAADGRIGLAVLPFRATVPEAAQWTEAIPDLLTAALDGTPGFRLVDPWSLWRTLRPKASERPRAPDVDEAAHLAERARACCFLLGTISQLGDRVDVGVRIYRRGSDEPIHVVSVAGRRDSLSKTVEQLALEIVRRMTPNSPSQSLARFDRALTRSPDALKAWLSAREFRRRGQIDSADAAITRALALDSTFLAAFVDAASIRSWVQFQRGDAYADLRPLAERAVRLGDSLPERTRLRAVAMLASINTEGARAADALQRILALDSADVDAWSLLSYVHMAYGWQYGRSARDMIASVDATLRLDSTDATAISRRGYLAIASNDMRDIERQMDRLLRADTSSPLLHGQLRAYRATRASDVAFPAMASELVHAPLPEWVSVFRMLRSLRPDRAELLAQRMFEASQPTSQRLALGAFVQQLSSEGRWTAIDSLRRVNAFARVANFDRTVDRLTVAAAIAGAGDDALSRRAVDTLAKTMLADSAAAWLPTRAVWLEGWLIGAYHAMFADTSIARRWAEALGKLPKGGSPPEYGAALGTDISARLAARRGDRKTALALAGRALSLWNIHTENQLELMPEPAMRFNLALLLRSEAQSDSAMVLFQSLVPPTTWMGFYSARASLELAELLEARGDREQAARHFLTAMRVWERADRALSALRERARRGVLGRG